MKISTISNGFRKAGLLCDDNEEDGTTADKAVQRQFESVHYYVVMFVSDTAEEDFSGFSTQEEDNERRLMADFSAIKGLLF